MARELAYVLINPYTIAKSRTGGVIARYIQRTDLNFVAARMYGPSAQLVKEYASLVRSVDPDHSETTNLIAEHILKSYAPNPATGRPRRVMLLLFEGEDAIDRIWKVTGSATLRSGSGQTIRDTYGDYVMDTHGNVTYFEPAVLVAPSKRRAELTLKLWARYSESDGGIIENATDLPDGKNERTLVLLKPDNFRYASARPGSIIDTLSSSGLRIVGTKKFCMTVAQAEGFYGPVRESLCSKFRDIGSGRAAQALKREFGFDAPAEVIQELCDKLGPIFAQEQFESIVKFMTGFAPSECSESEKGKLGCEGCLALVYEGPSAIQKIRALLGPTDPSKARPGSVRREFGSDIMVNAAHASDSADNAERELEIVDVRGDSIGHWVDYYYGGVLSRMRTYFTPFACKRRQIMRKARAREREEAAKA